MSISSEIAGANLTAVDAAVTLPTSGYGGVAAQIAGTFSGTVAFEGSADGTNYRAVLATPSNSTTQVTTATAPGLWLINAVGMAYVRARMTVATSGSAGVTLRSAGASPGQVGSGGGGGGGGTSSNFGDPFPLVGTAAGFIDASGNMAGATLSAAGNLKVDVAEGSSGNAAASATGAAVPADADYLGIKDSSGNLLGVAGSNLDYDTGAGTVGQTVFGLALPASGGPVGAIGGSGVVTTGTQRVTLATDVALPAGTNVIGHVIADTGSTTAVTGNVTVVQSTAASLNATVVVAAGSAVIGHVITDATSTTIATQATASNLKAQVTGAGTAGSADTGVQTVQGIASMTPLLATGTGTAGSAATGVVTVQGIASMTKLLVTPDSVALPANQSVNLAQVAGTNTVTAGVAGTQAVGGSVATNVAIGTNPVNLGAQAVSAENAAVTATRLVQLVADLAGKLIVLPYANPENFVSGAITSAMTGTTSTSLIGSPGGSLRNYITQITVSNGSTTIPTDILIQDGSGGTTLYVIPAPAGIGTGTGAAGATLTFPTPLRQPTTATALFVANVTTGSSAKVSASGYKGA